MTKTISNPHRSRGKQLLVWAFIYISISPLLETANKLMVLVLIAMGIQAITSNVHQTRVKDWLILAVFFVILIPYGFILDLTYAADITHIGVGFFIFITLGFLAAKNISREEFFKANNDLVAVSLLCGLPIYLILHLHPELLQSGYDYTYGQSSHKSFFALNVLTDGASPIQRFVGFGSEPGLTQIFYLISLFNRLQKNNGQPDVLVLIILIAIFLSGSTFGIFATIYILGTRVSLKGWLKYLVVSLPLIYFVVVDAINFHFSNKLWGTDSFAARYDRYWEYFRGDLIGIVFGHGNLYYSNFIAVADLGGWDSFLQVSQRYGLLFMLFLFACLYTSNRGTQRPIFAIICMSFFTQSVWLLPAIAYFFFGGNTERAKNCDSVLP